jgi:hypothetical protein
MERHTTSFFAEPSIGQHWCGISERVALSSHKQEDSGPLHGAVERTPTARRAQSGRERADEWNGALSGKRSDRQVVESGAVVECGKPDQRRPETRS